MVIFHGFVLGFPGCPDLINQVQAKEFINPGGPPVFFHVIVHHGKA
jgi:hypothetical protein